MRILAALLCVGLASCASVVDRAHENTVSLELSEGGCSGTIVGPHALLSATHCFGFGETLSLWRQPVQIVRRLDDGNDHTIIVVDRTFKHWAHVAPQWGLAEPVFMFGNPGDLTDMFRSGHYAGMGYIRGQLVDMWDMRIWFGDSGSAIFDSHGNVIAVVSFLYTLREEGGELTMAGSFPLRFSAEQWAEVTR